MGSQKKTQEIIELRNKTYQARDNKKMKIPIRGLFAVGCIVITLIIIADLIKNKGVRK
tara:strand:- start:5042 stop:5215 length:174 start_codon:yes stop_codon:yes gene_type:complete